MTLGTQIATYRKDAGMTQEALANQLGISNQAVSKWESDVCCPDVALLPKLADIFHITMDQLFGRETAAPPPVCGELPWEDDGCLRAVLFVGRTLQKHHALDRYSKERKTVDILYSGPALNIHSDFSVSCRNCTIEGNVHAGDSVSCGNIHGSVTAGDGVNCGNVDGNVRAGDGINCGNIGGNAQAGDNISCGDIGGDATAGDHISCGTIHGNAKADLIRCSGKLVQN